MLRDELQSKIDRLWDAFWSGGISNPLEVIEQVTYLIFVRQLDAVQMAKEQTAAVHAGELSENPIYTKKTEHLRWSRFIHEAPQNMLDTVRDGVFPWLRALGAEASTYARFIRDARFTVTTPNLLSKIVNVLNDVPFGERDCWGDMYEYMLSKVATAGHNGQFRTPRHIVELIVEMMAPGIDEEICDPACGTAGYLVAAANYVRQTHDVVLLNPRQHTHFTENMFHGFDFDNVMLRIASMNMLLHGIERPDIRYRDSLTQGTDGRQYSLILTSPPFAGSIDYESSAIDLQAVVKTKKTELLFVARVLQLLKPGGRAAIIVPDGVLFGTSKAHVDVRKHLVEHHKLEAVISLPPGTFRPYSGVSTSILIVTNAHAGGTGHVWFYEVTSDGWSLDDRRQSLLDKDKLGPSPSAQLTENDLGKNNLPDLLSRWTKRDTSERARNRAEQSFCVAKDELVECRYDLIPGRYRVTAGEGWRLGDFAEVLAGSVVASEINKNPDNSDLSTDQRVLHPSLLTARLPDVKDLPVRANLKEPRHRLRAGDIVGRDLAAARHWTVLPADYEGVQPGQGILIVRLTRRFVPAEYLAAYLATPQAEQQFALYGTIPRIRRNDLPNVRVPECEGDFEAIRAAIQKLKEGIEEAGVIQRRLQQSESEIFESGTKSQRRNRLERAADLSFLIARNLRKQREPYRVFQESYPYAIARAVRKFNHSTGVPEKHEAAIQCIEALITSLGIVSLAFVAHWGQQGLPEVFQWCKSVERGGVSLGQWVGVIRAATKFAVDSGDEAAGLAEAAASRKQGKGLLADLNELVKIRNRIRRGAGPRTRAEVEKSLEKLEQLMFQGLSSSAFLANTQWIHMDRLRWLPQVGSYEVSGLALMGDHPDFEPIARRIAYPLADDALYIFTPQGKTLPLLPFCTLGDCPQCLAPELYYPDRLTNSTALLKSLDRGHEFESDSIHNALRSWILS